VLADKILVFGDTESNTGLMSCVKAILHKPKHNVEYVSDAGDENFTIEHVKTVIIAVDTVIGVDAMAKGEFVNLERVQTILTVLANAKFGGNVMIVSPLPTGDIETVACPFQIATVAFDVPTVIPTPQNIKDAKRIIVGSAGGTGGWVKEIMLTSYIRKSWTIDVAIPETALYLALVSIAKVANETLQKGLWELTVVGKSGVPNDSSVEDFVELVFDHGGILPRRQQKLVP
jgi:hypothetical protein